MKKKFNAKSKKNKKSRKLFFFSMFFCGVFLSFYILDRSKIAIVSDKDFVQLLLEKSNPFYEKKTTSVVDKMFNFFLSLYNKPETLLSTSQVKLVNPTTNSSPVKKVEKQENKDPIIYIYNSHQTEEYAPSSFLEYSVNPTVMMNDYILEEVFNSNLLHTLVEERRIKDVLNERGWKYNASYKASRVLMEDAKKKYPSLKYFIDVHRDSLVKDKTTVQINEKSYAKMIFLIGLENANYKENLDFTMRINDKLNQKYPGLSKGIYKKGGAGVNGVYNQDFSPYTILAEFGGPENTTTEVLNSTLAFAECFMEVVNESKG